MISTDSSLVSLDIFNQWLVTSDMHWAKPVPPDVLQEMLDHSLVFGLYENPDAVVMGGEGASKSNLTMVGIARCVTDFTTFLYLTDVYVGPRLQGQGLGTWLILKVQEVIDSMPNLRRSLLFTSDWERSVPFYEKHMGVEVIESTRGSGMAILSKKGAGHVVVDDAERQ